MGEWVESLDEQARTVLPEAVYRYYRQGSRSEIAVAAANDAWDRLRLLPHVLRDVSAVDTTSTVLGTTLRTPFGVAPTTLHRAAHPDGEVAMASAVAAAESLLVVSSNAGSTFESIAATGVSWWLQAYVSADRSACVPLLRRAVDAGAQAVVVTVDTPVVGTKYDGDADPVWQRIDPAWLRANYHESAQGRAALEKAADLVPDDIGWLSDVTGLPVVVKGVLRPDDARLCVEAGASAVWVSNHGGRQLDSAVPTAEALPAVRAEVGEQVEVYVDGGLCHARHGFAALALGADALFLGRLPLFALAVEGGPGVERLLRDLGDELVETMRLAGCADLAAVGPDVVRGAES